MRHSAVHLKAFTLIEMMIVLAVIAILAMIAMPNNHNRNVQLQIVESLELIEDYKGNIERTYMLSGVFPVDNEAAGMPKPSEIRGNYLSELRVENGVLNLVFGQKMNKKYYGKVLSVRPVFVDSEIRTPVSWVCGADAIPEGMQAADGNSTSLELLVLPLRCR